MKIIKVLNTLWVKKKYKIKKNCKYTNKEAKHNVQVNAFNNIINLEGKEKLIRRIKSITISKCTRK